MERRDAGNKRKNNGDIDQTLVLGTTMTTELIHFTQKAQANPAERFSSLMGLFSDEAGLLASFERLAAKKAPGIDGMRKADYAKGVGERIAKLSQSLRQLGYRPKPVRRVYIPKLSGGRRPLGIPSFEDRIVQDRLSLILQTIWEPEFRECSYGFRPGRSAHGALKRLAEIITNERTQWVVEADIKGFFNHVSHDHLLRFLRHRIRDERMIRIIQRFLKAGIMEDGVVQASEEGTPQGGLVSPVLSNVYLHYVLDLWFEKRYAKSCRGKAHLVRFADDFVACFQDEEDAKRFLPELAKRLADFALEVEPTKTAMLRFGSNAEQDCKKDGTRGPGTFNFLGFTHYVGRSRRGNFMVGRQTEKKRFQRKLEALKERLKELRVLGQQAMATYARQHLQGHIQYYGVSGNSRSVGVYVLLSERLLFQWLNRRSQRRSMRWECFRRLLRQGLLPRARIIHNIYPKPLWQT
jgi:RNA-directed DNA polymerase